LSGCLPSPLSSFPFFSFPFFFSFSSQNSSAGKGRDRCCLALFSPFSSLFPAICHDASCTADQKDRALAYRRAPSPAPSVAFPFFFFFFFPLGGQAFYMAQIAGSILRLSLPPPFIFPLQEIGLPKGLARHHCLFSGRKGNLVRTFVCFFLPPVLSFFLFLFLHGLPEAGSLGRVRVHRFLCLSFFPLLSS